MLLMLPVLIPLFGGVLLLFLPSDKQKSVCALFLGMTLCAVAGCTLLYDQLSLVWALPFDLSIAMKIDEVGLFFSLIFAFVWWVAMLESFPFFKEPPPQYYPCYLAAFGGLMGTCYSYNLVTFYLFFEIASLVCFPLIILEQQKEDLEASRKYLFYALGGAFLGLISIFYFQSLDVAHPFTPGGAEGLAEVANHGEILGFYFLAVVGFGSKAGLFPLHSWLKVADPCAPSPAAAVLSGINTKLGVLAILRLSYYVVGADLLRDTFAQRWGITFALITIFLGSILAHRERQIKTRLAYSTLSQVAYIVFALLLFEEYAFVGAMLQMACHALGKSLLFLCAGQLINQTGQTQVEPLEIYPFNRTHALFGIGSLSLVGIPLTGGFVAKWYMGVGALRVDSFQLLGVVVIIFSAIFTANYLFPLAIKPYFTDRPPSWAEKVVVDPREGRYSPILAIGLIVLGIFPYPILQFLITLAEKLC
ncbi:MAG: proton-conducting transporter membrane subunit [Eubacteriales bacterium]